MSSDTQSSTTYSLKEAHMKNNALSRFNLLSALVLSAGLLFPAESPAGDMNNSAMMMDHQAMKAKMKTSGPIDFYLKNRDRLGLSDDQVQKLSAIKMGFEKTRSREMARLHDLRMGRMALLKHYRVDMAMTRSNTAAILMHRKTLMLAAAHMAARSHQVLSAGQYQMAETLEGHKMMKSDHMMAPKSMDHPGN